METAEDRALAYARQLMVARYVANHWRRVILDKFPDDSKWAAHPLCMVLAALDGETEPINLGLDPEVWDDFRVQLFDGPVHNPEHCGCEAEIACMCPCRQCQQPLGSDGGRDGD